jgi:PKHD-type hydroxylase
MLLRLAVLSPEVAARLVDSLSKPDLVDRCTGFETEYLELDNDAPETGDAGRIFVEALRTHPLFVLGVQPRSFSKPVLNRFDEGMRRGARVNDALIHRAGGMRADVAVTVFLTDPACYDGGEFVIDTGYGGESYKEPAGACLVYPTSAQYSVAPVIRGSRLTGELWVQSLIRNPAQRQILYDLGCASQYFDLVEGSASPDGERLRKCQQGLLRLWAEP